MNARRLKAQSAMEYLMTYGWAILIIAVVLGALFSLGVFSSATLLGNSCVAAPGYLCSGLTLASGTPAATNVTLSFTLGQSTGVSIYNVGVGCAAAAASTGLPYNGAYVANNAIVFINPTTGYATAFTAANVQNQPVPGGGLTMISGQSVKVAQLNCFGAQGAGLTSTTAPLGTAFTGYLWLNYTTASTYPTVSTGTNPELTVKIATITTKVV